MAQNLARFSWRRVDRLRFFCYLSGLAAQGLTPLQRFAVKSRIFRPILVGF